MQFMAGQSRKSVLATLPGMSLADESFVVPAVHVAGGLRLELLGPQHNEADHRAWPSSIEHIRSTPGFDTWRWPPPAGMTLDENLRDLESHADRSARRVDFAYSVLDEAGVVVGCVYLKPVPDEPGEARATSWVSADRAELDGPLTEVVGEWLREAWPFELVHYRRGAEPREIRGAEPVRVWDLTVTMAMARRIRAWRIDDECSYRVLATLADAEWGTATAGNQLFGEDLCIAAATMHGEHINNEPWY